MSRQPKNVVIVGGSLAGLLSGIVLKRLGHDVRIFERSAKAMLHNQGAGIVFGEEAQMYFRKYIDTDRVLSVTSYTRQYLNQQGEVAHEHRSIQKMISWELLYYILRAHFDGLASGYCEVPTSALGEKPASYENGHTALSLSEVGSQIELEFQTKSEEQITVSADLVIAADGQSSTIRKALLPEVERTYAGYVAWRGTVPEASASELLKDTFVDKFTFYHSKGIQILAYLIPGPEGKVDKGLRLINWVWYCNYSSDSAEYRNLMTDAQGDTHHFTVPVGTIQEELWNEQKEYAKLVLPPQFAALVAETPQPFLQAITDVKSTKVSFFDKRALLVGDAVAGLRPHTAASTSQAAYHAMLLDQNLSGIASWERMEKSFIDYAEYMAAEGIRMGNASQFGQ